MNRGKYYYLYLQGLSLSKLKREEEAIKDYTSAIEINP